MGNPEKPNEPEQPNKPKKLENMTPREKALFIPGYDLRDGLLRAAGIGFFDAHLAHPSLGLLEEGKE